jgi:hypothetical protein
MNHIETVPVKVSAAMARMQCAAATKEPRLPEPKMKRGEML